MAPNSTEAEAAMQQFLTDSDFFDNVALCDVQVHFSGTYIHAHKYQLSKYSPWFFQAFTGAFPVATANTIDLGNDDSPCLVFALLRHIYSLSYLENLYDPDNHFPQVSSTSIYNFTLSYNLEIFILADKYDVPSLRTLAVSAVMQELPNTLVDVVLADVCERIFGIVFDTAQQ
ncbi:hypothetical protein KCU65_g8987, partial [Aureobasidium melanogenum]